MVTFQCIMLRLRQFTTGWLLIWTFKFRLSSQHNHLTRLNVCYLSNTTSVVTDLNDTFIDEEDPKVRVWDYKNKQYTVLTASQLTTAQKKPEAWPATVENGPEVAWNVLSNHVCLIIIWIIMHIINNCVLGKVGKMSDLFRRWTQKGDCQQRTRVSLSMRLSSGSCPSRALDGQGNSQWWQCPKKG